MRLGVWYVEQAAWGDLPITFEPPLFPRSETRNDTIEALKNIAETTIANIDAFEAKGRAVYEVLAR